MDKLTNFFIEQYLTCGYDFGGMTTQEIFSKIAQKINILIEHFNYINSKVTNIDENVILKLDYLLGQGLSEQVARKILELIADGTLGTLINETLLADINTKVDTFNTSILKKLSDIQVSILDFGAVPNNETVDNSIHIQKAIDYVASHGGGKVFIPSGVFYVKNPIDIKAYVWIVGVGSVHIDDNNRGSVIEYNGTLSQNILQAHKVESDKYYRYGIGIKDVQLRGNDIGNGVSLKSCANTIMDNVIIEFCNIGMKIEGGMLDEYNRIMVRYCKHYGLIYPNTIQSTTQVFNNCYIGQHRTSDICVPIKIDNHATFDITFNNLVLESNNLSCKIGVACNVSFNNLYIENCPVKDTHVIELGYHDGNGWDLDNHNGVYSFNDGLMIGVPVSLGGYSGKNLLYINKADSITMTNCFFTKFEKLFDLSLGFSISPTLINCVMENGLFTNKFDSLPYATLINCRQDGTKIITNYPNEAVTPPLENSWVNTESGYQVFEVSKQGRLVNIKGCVRNGSTYTIATLPTNCRPKGRILDTCLMYNNDMWETHPIHVYADGTIQTNNGLKGNVMFNITYEI